MGIAECSPKWTWRALAGSRGAPPSVQAMDCMLGAKAGTPLWPHWGLPALRVERDGGQLQRQQVQDESFLPSAAWAQGLPLPGPGEPILKHTGRKKLCAPPWHAAVLTRPRACVLAPALHPLDPAGCGRGRKAKPSFLVTIRWVFCSLQLHALLTDPDCRWTTEQRPFLSRTQSPL